MQFWLRKRRAQAADLSPGSAIFLVLAPAGDDEVNGVSEISGWAIVLGLSNIAEYGIL